MESSGRLSFYAHTSGNAQRRKRSSFWTESRSPRARFQRKKSSFRLNPVDRPSLSAVELEECGRLSASASFTEDAMLDVDDPLADPAQELLTLLKKAVNRLQGDKDVLNEYYDPPGSIKEFKFYNMLQTLCFLNVTLNIACKMCERVSQGVQIRARLRGEAEEKADQYEKNMGEMEKQLEELTRAQKRREVEWKQREELANEEIKKLRAKHREQMAELNSMCEGRIADAVAEGKEETRLEMQYMVEQALERGRDEERRIQQREKEFLRGKLEEKERKIAQLEGRLFEAAQEIEKKERAQEKVQKALMNTKRKERELGVAPLTPTSVASVSCERHEEKINELQASLDEAVGRATGLEAEVDGLRAEVAQLQSRVDSTNEECAKLSKSLADMTAKHEAAVKEAKELRSEMRASIDALNAQVAHAMKREEELERANRTLTEELTAEERLCKKLAEELVVKEEQIRVLDDRKREMEEAGAKAAAELVEAKEHINELSAKLQYAEEEVSRLRHERSVVVGAASAVQKQVSSLQAKLLEAEEELLKLRESASGQNTFIKSLQCDLDIMQARLASEVVKRRHQLEVYITGALSAFVKNSQFHFYYQKLLRYVIFRRTERSLAEVEEKLQEVRGRGRVSKGVQTKKWVPPEAEKREEKVKELEVELEKHKRALVTAKQKLEHATEKHGVTWQQQPKQFHHHGRDKDERDAVLAEMIRQASSLHAVLKPFFIEFQARFRIRNYRPDFSCSAQWPPAPVQVLRTASDLLHALCKLLCVDRRLAHLQRGLTGTSISDRIKLSRLERRLQLPDVPPAMRGFLERQQEHIRGKLRRIEDLKRCLQHDRVRLFHVEGSREEVEAEAEQIGDAARKGLLAMRREWSTDEHRIAVKVMQLVVARADEEREREREVASNSLFRKGGVDTWSMREGRSVIQAYAAPPHLTPYTSMGRPAVAQKMRFPRLPIQYHSSALAEEGEERKADEMPPLYHSPSIVLGTRVKVPFRTHVRPQFVE